MNFESMLKFSVILKLEEQSRIGKVAGFQFFQSVPKSFEIWGEYMWLANCEVVQYIPLILMCDFLLLPEL